MTSEAPAPPAKPRKRNGWLPILVFGVAQRHLSQYFVPLRPLLFDAMERLDAVKQTHERVTGIPAWLTREVTEAWQASDRRGPSAVEPPGLACS